MSGSQVQSKGAQVASAASVSVTLNSVVSGNHINAFCFNSIAPALASSSPAATWLNAIANAADSGSDSLRCDYTENVASGTWTVTGNSSSGTTNGVTVAASESSGVKTSSSLGTHNHNEVTTTTVTTGTITPTAGSVLYAGMHGNGGGSAASTIDTGFTVDEAGGAGTCWDGANTSGGSAHLNNTTAVATNPTWTSGLTTTTHMGAGIVEFLATVAANIPPGLGPVVGMPEWAFLDSAMTR